jgi:hypothetical protein
MDIRHRSPRWEPRRRFLSLIISLNEPGATGEYLHEKAQLPGGLVCGALQDLGREMGGEGHDLACDEGVAALVALDAQGRAVEQSGQVERRQRVEDNDFVGGVGVDGVVERKLRCVVVIGFVESRVRGGE